MKILLVSYNASINLDVNQLLYKEKEGVPKAIKSLLAHPLFKDFYSYA